MKCKPFSVPRRTTAVAKLSEVVASGAMTLAPIRSVSPSPVLVETMCE
jgi:hypothetical protein